MGTIIDFLNNNIGIVLTVIGIILTFGFGVIGIIDNRGYKILGIKLDLNTKAIITKIDDSKPKTPVLFNVNVDGTKEDMIKKYKEYEDFSKLDKN